MGGPGLYKIELCDQDQTDHRTELSEKDSHRKKALETNFLSSPTPLCRSLIQLILNYFSGLIRELPG